MPLYRALITMTTHVVVIADDEEQARFVAKDNAKQAFSDDLDCPPEVSVFGEVTNVTQLRDGWDGACVPYGGDGNTRIGELLA